MRLCRAVEPFEDFHARAPVLRGEDSIGVHQLRFRDRCLDKCSQTMFNVRPDRTAGISQLPLCGCQNAALIQPAMGVVKQFVERERFGGVLSHPRFSSVQCFGPMEVMPRYSQVQS